ncbi:MAG: hypothetical protein A2900_02080 [Candidatus Chisholmbacteria bacterium RIFCSPLOWO2_01_FULL_50_28]|uniref:Uncharacterized protein n=1 Tax=Candidatus Chisholmbacteria bacterium RIFCSPHIGHO2_01_FULL_52_32 TaxID=1797591 RepID=A0A1G1VTM7_9BACT|nr:MAG: hypothetical protein A2786_04665 [Candidatus Chisholmbacteria bacterium RIFCSPHIGHO2_01_FULL_52_32]OGY19872.1 MAG: hypothetical protein A2900_02080 [Candidatus Chisholmbacteria bacterium RIFCSPLOWO2_01_FULL_50_28]
MEGSQALYQISLIAAFAAGIVALFAPCCISYLLPAYFANIFKEKKRVLMATLIYSLGIFVVMLPVVLGAKALSLLFFRLHDQTYTIGGIFMLVLAAFSLLGIKLPMPHFALRQKEQEHDPFSTFTLGIFSGITSACCAPVLIGVVTLSALTPTTLQALGVGLAYVFGMVTPLYLASAFIHKRNILEKPILRRKVGEIALGTRRYPIYITNIIATAIFTTTGLLTIILSQTGMLGMPGQESAVVKLISDTAMTVTGFTAAFPAVNAVFAGLGGYLLYRFLKETLGK